MNISTHTGFEQDWKSDRSAKLKSGSKIHESMNAGFELNN